MTEIKTVVELDMVGYSDVARQLEERLGVKVVAMFNEKIQGFVNEGLKAVKKFRDEVVKASNGDNAVIVFESAEDAHLFAQAVHQATEEHNSTRSETSKCWFRIGAATGELYQNTTNGKQEIAGNVISRAYRLEAAAQPGEFLIDIATYDALNSDSKQLYGNPETVSGKREEKFSARRLKVIPCNMLTTDLNQELLDVNELFEKLNPRRDRLLQVMQFLKMPLDVRPDKTNSLLEKQNTIVEWVYERDKNYKKLIEVLNCIIEKQYPQMPLR